MADLLALSNELLLIIASFLPQVDLLNLTLTSKRLRNSTEPELFREYINPIFMGRSCKPFLRRIIGNPGLARYVRYLDIKTWTTLVEENPHFGEGEYDRSPSTFIRGVPLFC